jgi:hypothetical protein
MQALPQRCKASLPSGSPKKSIRITISHFVLKSNPILNHYTKEREKNQYKFPTFFKKLHFLYKFTSFLLFLPQTQAKKEKQGHSLSLHPRRNQSHPTKKTQSKKLCVWIAM